MLLEANIVISTRKGHSFDVVLLLPQSRTRLNPPPQWRRSQLTTTKYLKLFAAIIVVVDSNSNNETLPVFFTNETIGTKSVVVARNILLIAFTSTVKWWTSTYEARVANALACLFALTTHYGTAYSIMIWSSPDQSFILNSLLEQGN